MTDSRKAAEQAYTVSAFDYPTAPVGSRDWSLFWKGWQAAEKNDVYQETVVWQTARANHAERERDEWKAKAEANARVLTMMTKWLETNQKDVFRRGLWDAINASRSAEKESK